MSSTLNEIDKNRGCCHCKKGSNVALYIYCTTFQRAAAAGGVKATSSPAENYHLARRRTLQVVVSALLTESGFDSAEKAAVETLTEMMQSCMYEKSVASTVKYALKDA